ncbi:IucA/IucC family C-terminal-domain containing protein [Paenibacillus kobensis]|uniref:IucA/IucC family C-terminal-domain containing protein n=1 Tax=Paenibacillus kobensis TaxID=59841 RepID=UPI000FD9AEE9|nr:IucA/IucC family C-terminal-domain containing protein [Paenibacillus kobensis]
MDSRALEIAFSPEEQDLLVNQYRLTFEPLADRTLSISSAELLDADRCREYLGRMAELYETSSDIAAASMFAKRYSYLTIASSLYAMTMLNKGMDYSVTNSHVESYRQGQAWLPKIRLTDSRITQPEHGERSTWRNQVIRTIFAGNLAPVWQSISASAKVSRAVLWENTAIYVYHLYENVFGEGATCEQQARLEQDYRYLLTEAPAALFGENNNPMTRFNSPKQVTAASDNPIRIRKTCCYYYLAADDPEDYCPTCPKLKHEVAAAE